jgi:DNA-binding FadR family transcriptional regulator
VAALRAVAADQRDAGPPAAPLLYARLWNHVVDGADNIAYRLAYNSLLAGLDPDGEASRALFTAEACDHEAIGALVAAIAARIPGAAADAAEDLLTRALAPSDEIDHRTKETARG